MSSDASSTVLRMLRSAGEARLNAEDSGKTRSFSANYAPLEWTRSVAVRFIDCDCRLSFNNFTIESDLDDGTLRVRQICTSCRILQERIRRPQTSGRLGRTGRRPGSSFMLTCENEKSGSGCPLLVEAV